MRDFYVKEDGNGTLGKDAIKLSDLEAFESFFQLMGVTYESLEDDTGTFWETDETVNVLTVTQAHFVFDDHGNYLGVVADEIDEVLPRERKESTS